MLWIKMKKKKSLKKTNGSDNCEAVSDCCDADEFRGQKKVSFNKKKQKTKTFIGEFY